MLMGLILSLSWEENGIICRGEGLRDAVARSGLIKEHGGGSSTEGK